MVEVKEWSTWGKEEGREERGQKHNVWEGLTEVDEGVEVDDDYSTTKGLKVEVGLEKGFKTSVYWLIDNL